MKNIATGVVADNDVNAGNLISTGKIIVCEIEGKDVYKWVLKRRYKVKTMSSKTSMSLQDKEVHRLTFTISKAHSISKFLKYWLRRLQGL